MTTRASGINARQIQDVVATTCMERHKPCSRLVMVAVNLEAEKPAFWRARASYDSCLRRLERAIRRAEHASALGH